MQPLNHFIFLFSPNYNPDIRPFLLAKSTTLPCKDSYVLINFMPLTTRPSILLKKCFATPYIYDQQNYTHPLFIGSKRRASSFNK